MSWMIFLFTVSIPTRAAILGVHPREGGLQGQQAGRGDTGQVGQGRKADRPMEGGAPVVQGLLREILTVYTSFCPSTF